MIIIYESLLIELSHFFYDKAGSILFILVVTTVVTTIYLFCSDKRSCTTICEECVLKGVYITDLRSLFLFTYL